VTASEIACDLFAATLERLDPGALVASALRAVEIDTDVVVLAVGKAAARMATGAVSALGARVVSGLVVVPEADHVPAPLVMRVGSHPVANPASERAGRALLDAASRAAAHQTVLALISGGASALAAVPAPGLTLSDKNFAVSAVMASGAPIGDINTVRKHLSAIKGGRLAAASRAPVLSLISSDVVGDDLASIGSGPTVPDPTTNADARRAAPAPRRRHAQAARRALRRAARRRHRRAGRRRGHGARRRGAARAQCDRRRRRRRADVGGRGARRGAGCGSARPGGRARRRR
jgi:hydroxypyruvate reductase